MLGDAGRTLRGIQGPGNNKKDPKQTGRCTVKSNAEYFLWFIYVKRTLHSTEIERLR